MPKQGKQRHCWMRWPRRRSRRMTILPGWLRIARINRGAVRMGISTMMANADG